jgi:RNA polymerase sigma-B factor
MAAESRDSLRRFEEYRRTRDRDLRNSLTNEYRWIAVHCARRFDKRGEPLDDLIQVGQLGVLKAVERFDPEFGVAFATFAMPTVLGEMRRHFRDATWPVRVPRRVKEMHLELGTVVEHLAQELGRPPLVEEIATRVGASVEAVLEAMEAGSAYRSAPLSPANDGDRDDDASHDGGTIGADDPSMRQAETRLAMQKLLRTLPPRERKIVYLRFFEGLTQAEIADAVGVSQVHVSRLLQSSLQQLQRGLGPADDDTAVAG